MYNMASQIVAQTDNGVHPQLDCPPSGSIWTEFESELGLS